MEIKRVNSGTKESVLNKEYILGIGISLGNKFFSPENTLEYIDFCFTYSKGFVVVYVADTIHAYNIQVRKRVSFEKAKELAKQEGADIISKLKEYTDKLPKEFQERIKYFSWSDIENTAEYQEKMNFIFDFYNQNSEFKNELRQMVRSWVSKEERKFNDEDIETFIKYFLSELPECLDRVPIGGLECDAYLYPSESSFTDLVFDIQNGVKFKEIKEFIITVPKITIIIS
jgi:tRNA-dependent cyclodipeptide synthase